MHHNRLGDLRRATEATAPSRASEAGDTLIEVLVAVTIIGIAVVALLGGLLVSTSASTTHRSLATIDGVLKSFAETAKNAIETQSSNGSVGPQFACPATGYQVVGSPYPSSGPPNTVVAVLGLGFSGASYPSATFNSTAVGASAVSGSSTSGAVSEMTVPTLAAGTYSLTPFDATHGADSQFTITPSIGAMQPAVAGVVGQGTKVKVSATGFAASSTLTVQVGSTTLAAASVTGNPTSAFGVATLTFTLPNPLSGSQSVTISDGATPSNVAPAELLNVATDTGTADPIETSSAFSSYTLTSSISYWTGNAGSLTLASSPLWSTNPGLCASGPDPNLQLLTLSLQNSQPNSAAGDSISVVLGNLTPLAVTSTVLASSTNPSVVGQQVTYTATISSNSGTPPASDTVAFADGGTPIACGPGSTVFNGTTATCVVTYTSTSGSPRSITATFSGDTNFGGSAGALTQTINQAATTTSVVSSGSPSVVGQPVTYTATLAVTAPGAGTPTGNIEFLDGATAIAACGGTAGTPLAGTTATCPATYNAVGSHTITAKYLGDTNFSPSTSPPVTQTVSRAGTTTVVVSTTGSPSVVGQPVTYTATLAVTAPGAGTPTGNIEFLDGATAIAACGGAAGTPLAGTTDTCTVTYNTVGSHTITAKYLGDTNFSPSTSPSITQTVNAAATVTTVTSSANNVSHATQITFTATVSISSPGGGTPASGDSMTFKDGGTTLSCTTQSTFNGTISTCKITLGVGTHSITAVFGGDANYAGSTSVVFTETLT